MGNPVFKIKGQDAVQVTVAEVISLARTALRYKGDKQVAGLGDVAFTLSGEEATAFRTQCQEWKKAKGSEKGNSPFGIARSSRDLPRMAFAILYGGVKDTAFAASNLITALKKG